MCVKIFDNAFWKNKCRRMLKVVGEPMNWVCNQGQRPATCQDDCWKRCAPAPVDREQMMSVGVGVCVRAHMRGCQQSQCVFRKDSSRSLRNPLCPSRPFPSFPRLLQCKTYLHCSSLEGCLCLRCARSERQRKQQLSLTFSPAPWQFQAWLMNFSHVYPVALSCHSPFSHWNPSSQQALPPPFSSVTRGV